MARKSRKRRRGRPSPRPPAAEPPEASAEQATAKPARARAARRRPGPDDPPPAPWGSFPLVEIVVFVAIVMLIGGFVVSGTQGAVMIGTGLVLGSLGGLELSVREHFAGYRSHTLLLAAAAAIFVLGILFFLAPSAIAAPLRIAAAAVVFALAAWWLTGVFRRRSGGLAFRVGGFRER